MTSPAEYKKLGAQSFLATQQVQPLLEKLTQELALTRPVDPIAALLARLDNMEAPLVLSSRVVVSLLGGAHLQQPVTSARGPVLQLRPAELVEHAAHADKGASPVPVPAELQAAVAQALQARTPVPTEVLTALVANAVTQAETTGTLPAGDKLVVLLEGYPRTIAQALALEQALGIVEHAVLLCGGGGGAAAETSSVAWQDQDASIASVLEYWKAKKRLEVLDASAGGSAAAPQLKALLDNY